MAIKIILKKNVKGHEDMVLDELAMLKKLNHPHIVHFRDWFESRVSASSSAEEVGLNTHESRINSIL